jgi:hypothetical protein
MARFAGMLTIQVNPLHHADIILDLFKHIQNRILAFDHMADNIASVRHAVSAEVFQQTSPLGQTSRKIPGIIL